jgi:hypothetical protein
MRTRHALLALAGLTTLFAGGLTGLAGVAFAAAPAPAPAPPAPTTPTYICDTINAVPPGVFAYNHCQGYGGVAQSGFILDNRPYTVIPRKGDIQKYRCSGGNADLPTSIAPAICSPVGPSIPAAQAPPPVPYTAPPPGYTPY